jgi:hypothetical protein
VLAAEWDGTAAAAWAGTVAAPAGTVPLAYSQRRDK